MRMNSDLKGRSRLVWLVPLLLVALAVLLGVLAQRSGGLPAAALPDDAPVQITTPAPRPLPQVGNERTLQLHRIDMGSRPTAQLSMEGVSARAFGIGEELAPGIRVQAIAARTVVIRAGDRTISLTWDPQDPTVGDRSGLDPEPVTMPELSAEEIMRRQGSR